jgi:hypothetical protein
MFRRLHRTTEGACLLFILLAGCTGAPRVSAPASSPRLLTPAVNADVQTLYPEFTWREVAGATSYVISITPAGGGAATSNTTSTPRFISGVALEVGADYSWTVEPRNAIGPGPAATPRLFRVVENTLPAAPVHEVVASWTLGNGETAWSDNVGLLWGPRGAPGPDDHSELEMLFSDGAHMAGLLTQGTRPAPFLNVHLDDGRGSRAGDGPGVGLTVGVECGEAYMWRVRTLRGSLLRPPLSGFDALASAFGSGVDMIPARSPWSNAWTFHIPEVVPQPPMLRSPANGASVNSGRLEWSHPLYPAEPLVYEVEITSNTAEHQQAFWVYRWPQSPSLRDADRERLVEPYFPVVLGAGGTVYWRVRASRAEGLCAGPWSDWWSFTWTGPAEGLGSLQAPTCITNAEGQCYPTATIASTVTRTPRPTATRTPTASPTLVGGPEITIIAFTATSPPTATKTPIPPPPTDTKEPPPSTEKPKDTEPPPQPIETPK